MRTIPEQLTAIYFKYEGWHVFKMSREQAINYHAKRIKNGNIQVYVDNGEVLGYVERHYVCNACFFDNVWIKDKEKRSKVFKVLYKQFFDTLPKNITHVIGHRNKKVHIVKISEWRINHGRYKD